jgi:hypothetical protein
MHYGEMPRSTLGSSDLRSQVAIFGEWNIYGTRKISFYLIMTSYHWNVRQNILTWRWWMNDKITWRHERNVVSLPYFYVYSIGCRLIWASLFFIVFQLFVSWTVFFKYALLNVVTSCLLWRHRWMQFYTKFINRTLALEGCVLKSLKIGSLEK